MLPSYRTILVCSEPTEYKTTGHRRSGNYCLYLALSGELNTNNFLESESNILINKIVNILKNILNFYF